MKKLIREFKDFAIKGNIIDLAVAVVIGGAFSAIVKAFVDDIISPFIGVLVGGSEMELWQVTIGGAVVKYGHFLQAIINFLIIAFALFVAVKIIKTAKDKLIRHEEEKVEEKVDKNILLLEEIRDLLKDRR